MLEEDIVAPFPQRRVSPRESANILAILNTSKDSREDSKTLMLDYRIKLYIHQMMSLLIHQDSKRRNIVELVVNLNIGRSFLAGPCSGKFGKFSPEY
jgi:hypothetical protein